MDSSRVAAVRHELLSLHKALIEAARIELERVEGRLTANEMLDRLMTDERLTWLQPLTTIIVGMDELLESETPDAGDAYLVRTLALLTVEGAPEGEAFAAEYGRLLQERPEVTMAHAGVMRVLR
jgi:hypothetical protein